MTEDRDWRARVTYRRPDGSKDDEETILDFVNEHFVPFEPLNVAINMCEKGYRMAWFDNYVRAFVREGHSLVAMDGADVVGVAIYTKGADSKGDEDGDLILPCWAAQPVKFGKVLHFLDQIASTVDLSARYRHLKHLELFILCTHSTIRRPGLGKALAQESLELAVEDGFDLVVTEATSLYSQKILTRLGFDTLKEVPFEDYRPDGEVVFPRHGDHSTVCLMAKKI